MFGGSADTKGPRRANAGAQLAQLSPGHAVPLQPRMVRSLRELFASRRQCDSDGFATLMGSEKVISPVPFSSSNAVPPSFVSGPML